MRRWPPERGIGSSRRPAQDCAAVRRATARPYYASGEPVGYRRAHQATCFWISSTSPLRAPLASAGIPNTRSTECCVVMRQDRAPRPPSRLAYREQIRAFGHPIFRAKADCVIHGCRNSCRPLPRDLRAIEIRDAIDDSDRMIASPLALCPPRLSIRHFRQPSSYAPA